MFDLKKPCKNCPFRVGQGELYQLHQDRLQEIFNAPAFQCHKTVDYSGENPSSGNKPQQCAGLMAVLVAEGRPNQIMQVAERLGYFDPGYLDRRDVYDSIDSVMAAHER